LEELKDLNLDYIDILYSNYVYVVPSRVSNPARQSLIIKALLDKYGYLSQYSNFDRNFYPQENRYVKIISDANPNIAQMIKNLKLEYYTQRTR